MALVLWFLLGLLPPACPLTGQQDVLIPNHYPGFKNLLHLPFERRIKFTPYFNVFSSWRNRRPVFHTMPDVLPIMTIPKVQVLCDDSLLTVLVDKRFGPVTLSKEEVQLGDGCFSTKDLPNKLVFSYRFNQCGTTREIKNGFGVFSNSIHLNVQEPLSARKVPSQMHISCMSTRSDENSNQHDLAALPETSRTFTIRAMNPSWTDSVASHVYKRGQTVHLQVSAKLRPQEQLFVQSCFISTSPEPDAKPRHPIIMNRGCITALGSPHPVTKFVDSRAADLVHFELNTTFMMPQMFVHCSVLVAEQSLSSGSKSCNYNLIQSRWEELSGDVEVCSCCMSKCKGLLIKNLKEEATAIVTAGPFIIEPVAPEVDLSMQADDGSIGEPVNPSWSPQALMVLNRDSGRVALWYPGRVQMDEASQPSEKLQTDGESNLTLSGQESHLQPYEVTAPTWPSSPLPQTPAATEPPVKHEDLHQWPPVIRSKLEISKGKDGSQSLSYEEEVLLHDEDSVRTKRARGQRGLMPTLLDLFRRLDGAE